MIREIKSTDEFNELTRSGTVIVDFDAMWCGPGRAILPYFNELSMRFREITFLRVDIDELDVVTSEVQVESMPSFLVYMDGKVIDRLIGSNVEMLELFVKKYAQIHR